MFIRKGGGSGATTLSALTDTSISSPSDGQMLAYDNGSSKWKNKTIAANNGETPVRELKTLQIGDNVFDTFGLKTYDVASVTSGVSGAISVDVITASQLNGEIIAIYTGSNTGTTGNAWTLALSDSQTVEALTMSKADGTAFTDALTANSLMFVKVNTSNDTAVVLGIVGAGSTVQANPAGSPVTELNKLKIGNYIFDTTAIRPHTISSISSGSMTVHVTNLDQLNGKVIAICTESNTGTTTLAWELNLSDGGLSAGISMTKADGTDFTDAIVANELLFVYVDADNFVATVLGIAGASGASSLSALSDTAITTPTNGQVLGYNSTSGKWENQNPSGGEVYFDATATLSTSTTTTVTFTESEITTSSVIDIAVSEWGLTPEDVTVTTGVCTVIMPKVSTARSITVRIYVR